VEEPFQFDPGAGTIRFEDRRMLIMEAAAMGILRQELVETLGNDRTRDLLFRFAFGIGAQDAESLRKLKTFSSAREWWEAGPPLRALEGIGLVTPRNLVFDQENKRFYVELQYRNSFEAQNVLRFFGRTERPACWIMTGFASGHASTCFGEKILFIEQTCVSRGDSECLLVGKPARDWGAAAEPLLQQLEGESVEQVINDMQSEIQALRAEAEVTCSFSNIVGRSPAMLKVLDMACDVARTEAAVLLLGESGTGKELIARAIHYNSKRSAGPFVAVNCAAIQESLLESELFGHEKGAFTGADKVKPGKFQRAAGGTLFLDEIGDMSPSLQAKILRVLQEKEFEPVGSTKVLASDVRVITATNRPLKDMVMEKTFREDLYYRISVFPIRLPTLRQRPEDILPLARHFLKRFSGEIGKRIPEISKPAQDQITNYPWPGNVRELQNAIERGVILSHGEAINSNHLGIEIPPGNSQWVNFELPDSGISIDEVERDFMTQAMNKTQQNKTAAAKLLGLSRSALRYRLEKFGLDS